MAECVFCSIVIGESPASIVYESEAVLGFMTLQPTRPGECLLIPKAHIDHFTDIPNEIASEIIIAANRIGRKLLNHFDPLRVGMVVHGFGVSHAHLILVPQHDFHDITSARFASIVGDEIVFNLKNIPKPDRKELDRQAALLRIDPDA